MAILLAGASLPASSVFSLRQIDVQGTRTLTAAEVVAASGLTPSTRSIFLINAREVSMRLAGHPRIAAAKVEARAPHTIRITVRERVAVAAVPFTRGYTLVDSSGIVISMTTRRPQVPLVSERGRMLTWATPGHVIASSVARDALALLPRLAKELQADLVHLQISREREAFLYMRDGLEIRGGPLRGLTRRLEAAPEVLRRLRAEGAVLAYVDFSVADQVVIKPRAAP